jgi:hypothetical protein
MAPRGQLAGLGRNHQDVYREYVENRREKDMAVRAVGRLENLQNLATPGLTPYEGRRRRPYRWLNLPALSAVCDSFDSAATRLGSQGVGGFLESRLDPDRGWTSRATSFQLQIQNAHAAQRRHEAAPRFITARR